MERKTKAWILILIIGIVVFGFSFKSVNAFPADMYDSYDVKGKIVNLEIIEEETSEMYGITRFTLEVLKATFRLKGNLHDEISPLKSGDILEAGSYYSYKYGEHMTVSVNSNHYDPSEFKEGDIIQASLLYAGSDSILLNDPKHINNSYYIYAIVYGSAVILIIFLVFIVRHKRKK